MNPEDIKIGERKAMKECRRLNEVEDSINRAFAMAEQDRKEQHENA